MNPTTLLQQALQAHQQGLLDAASRLYRQVLAHNPRQFDALHLLGVIARQRGDAAGAAALIRDALQIDPSQARAHCNLGAALQDLGEPQAALDSYDQALRLDPRYALAWDNRGNALRRLGRLDDALTSYEQALGLHHDSPDAWCHRAIVLHDLGRFDDAATSAAHALQVRSDWPEALLALGNALQALERFDEACAAYDRALAPAQSQTQARADIWCARGSALKKAGALEAALASYERALALDPGYALAQHYRANTLRALGRKPEAISAYRAALLLGADAAEIGFALAALGEGTLPSSAPPDYIKGLFDQYAGHFDQHLVEVLAYRTPALLDELLHAHVTATQDEVLDLGCGTGLCAPFLRPLARRLTGVDLSQRMLDKARASGHYDALVCADILEFLAHGVQVDPQAGRYGLVLAADVFVYIGDLSAVFAGVARALRSGGWFAFSVEAPAEGDGADGTGYAITPSNRFTHAPAYIARLAADNGFTTVETRAATLRREHGRDVAGQLVLLRRR